MGMTPAQIQAATDALRVISDGLKHLPGQHDQSTHGRRGVHVPKPNAAAAFRSIADIPTVRVVRSVGPKKPKKVSKPVPRNLLDVPVTEMDGQKAWEDLDTVGEGQNYPNLEMAAVMVFSRLGPEYRGRVLKKSSDVDAYITDTLRKAGYGERIVSITNDAKYLGPKVEAAVSRGMTETLPEDHPLYNTPVPVFLYRKRGVSEVVLLHEIAHIIEGAWKEPEYSGGHTPTWWETWGQLMKQNGGLDAAINMAEFFGYSMEGKGVFK